jgi:1,4-dihydroxy-2-naphthoate octaprenyltransferase
MTRSTFLHLRLPFSYFLLPIFLLGAMLARGIDWANFFISFAIIHFLLYPASNAFNSYYDRDAGSIGCLKSPPKVEPALLPVSLALDAAAVAAGFLISWQFAAALFLYGLCSKFYSFSGTRLKRRPILSWLGTSFVQGGFMVLTVNAAVRSGDLALEVLTAAGIATLFLMGCYPTTQIYQHEEDAARGDRTISMMVGVNGTFILSGVLMTVSAILLGALLWQLYGRAVPVVYALLQLPAAVYFARWYVVCCRDESKADYEHAMRFNLLSASGLNLFCAGVIYLQNQ